MSRRHYTQLKFGYDDGNARTVMLIIGDGDAATTLEDNNLDKITAAFFHLRGHAVTPGIKSFGLRKYKNGFTTTVTDDFMSRKRIDVGPTHYSMSIDDTNPGDLRLWIQSTLDRSTWLDIRMNKKTADEFGRRIAEAAEWDVG
jgi:hypothetical protein